MTSRVLFRGERGESFHAGLVLGLDTSGPVASMALAEHGSILAELDRRCASHGADLPGTVQELLSHCSKKFTDLTRIAVGIGPGSFTGLRVGISYVKGLAMGLRCEAVGVPTFDAIALGSLEHRLEIAEGSLICPVVDARRGEVYAALYRVVKDGVENIKNPLVLTLEDLVTQVSETITFVGDSCAQRACELAVKRGMTSTFVPDSELNSRGRFVAAIGAMRHVSNADSIAALEPLYVRTAEATFKPGAAGGSAAAKERPWSTETKSSSGSM